MSIDTTIPSLFATMPVTTNTPAPGVKSAALSAADRRLLKTALNAIKLARAGAKSVDASLALPARRRLAHLLCYVLGFLDGKKLIDVSRTNPGFESAFENQPSNLSGDAELDRFQQSLEKAIEDTNRGPMLGGILIAIGVGLKVLAEWVRHG